jgi:hypothetical protein
MRLIITLSICAVLALLAPTSAGPPRHPALSRRPAAIFYYVPYAPPVLVVSPYAPAYLLPPTVVATSPYFCVLHNEGFVSRVGLLDHLAGAHQIALDAALSLCPDGAASCMFPTY